MYSRRRRRSSLLFPKTDFQLKKRGRGEREREKKSLESLTYLRDGRTPGVQHHFTAGRIAEQLRVIVALVAGNVTGDR